jgi:arylsulfatase A
MKIDRGLRCLLVLAIGFCLVPSAVVAQQRPNIILIMADDVGYECFGCYGSKQYQTPQIDRLARQGIRFNHCYSQPLCTPSRVKLMTGLSNVRNYSAFSILNRDQRTIGQYFKEAGYQTMIAGKWQLLGSEHYSAQFRGKGSRPEKMGFDESCLWQVDKLGSRYWEPLLYINGKNRQFNKDQYGPTLATAAITQFMQAQREKPFFVYYPMIQVHSPFLPTPDSKSRTSKNQQKNFEDMVSYLDKLVGRIASKAEQLGIAQRTLILFVGDNGTHKRIKSQLQGQTIVGGKGKTTDAGTRVPFVAYWPGVIKAGQVSEDLVDFSDFLPTTLEAIQATVPAGLDGQSFLPQLLGKPGKPRQWMHCYYCPRPEKIKPVRFVRDQRWKLYGSGQFFDVSSDPLEQRPLAKSALNGTAAEAHRKLAAALQSMPAKGQSLLKFAK